SGRMYYILKAGTPIKHFAGFSGENSGNAGEKGFSNNSSKKCPVAVACCQRSRNRDKLFFICCCAWISSDPFEDAAATRLILGCCPPALGHLNLFWVGTLGIDLLDHGLI